MNNNYENMKCVAPTNSKPGLTEKLDRIFGELMECEIIAGSIEDRLYGPQPCEECDGAPSDMSIENQINQIGSTVARIKRILLDIKSPL